MTRYKLKFTMCMLVLSVAIGTTSATAQEPGVSYDPDSPAGQQYGLPLSDAPTPGDEPDRKSAAGASAGGPAAPARDTGGVTLFGSGVATPEDGQRRAPSASRTTPDAASEENATPDAVTSLPSRRDEQVTQTAAGLSGTTVSLGFAGVALLVGLLAAMGVRRADSRRPTAL